MTGFAFLLFTFYMISDPSTTPAGRRGQILFGAGVALTYGALISLHVVDTIFFSLTFACACRGAALWVGERRRARRPVAAPLGSLRADAASGPAVS
ncbi:MAG TPA: hypothetical protein VN783_06885 [Thermoanaerobaculia bacterium]|nr:hypothetical protein [Thermoanaerobaculia bacterium]